MPFGSAASASLRASQATHHGRAQAAGQLCEMRWESFWIPASFPLSSWLPHTCLVMNKQAMRKCIADVGWSHLRVASPPARKALFCSSAAFRRSVISVFTSAVTLSLAGGDWSGLVAQVTQQNTKKLFNTGKFQSQSQVPARGTSCPSPDPRTRGRRPSFRVAAVQGQVESSTRVDSLKLRRLGELTVRNCSHLGAGHHGVGKNERISTVNG